MAIAYYAATIATAYTATGTQTTSHAGSALTSGAVVLIDQNGSVADQVSGVTYGGVAMTRLRFDTEATEAGAVYIYWLDNVATGTQNVAMTTTGTANKQLVVGTMTVTAGRSIAVAGHNTGTSASAANPAWSITGLTAGTKLECYEVIHSGLTSMTTTPAASWSRISSTDLGAQGRGFAQQSVASSGTSLACGWTASTADDFVGASVAFKEVSGANQGSGAGTSTFTGAATGQRTPKGSAVGTSTFTGSASGKRTPKGAATGASTFTGIATGKRTPKGSTSGTSTFTGTTSGQRISLGSGTGTSTFTGVASGARVSTGSGAGSVTFTGTATGTCTPKGSGTGTATWTGAAVGQRAPKGASTGSSTWTGAAAGFAPAIGGASGSASGASTFTGSASGVRASWGSASGTSTFTGTASGQQTPKGDATGTLTFTGTASGAHTPKGVGTGTATWSGTATGSAPASSGRWRWWGAPTTGRGYPR